MSIPAQYQSWCPSCEMEIDIGDDIVKDDALGAWVHEGCA